MANIFRRSLASFLPAAILITLLVSLGALIAMNNFYGEVMAESLGSSVDAIAASMPEGAGLWFDGPTGEAEAWVTRLDKASGFRLTLIRPDGRVIADSRADPSTMENHGGRPEIKAAYGGRTGIARRTSATLGRDLYYAARAMGDTVEGGPRGVIRIAVDLPSLRSRLAPARDLFLALMVCVGLASALAAAIFARSVSMPLRRLSESALSYGRGAKSRRAGPMDSADPRDEIRLAALASGPDEVRVLAGALDAMVRELEGRNRAELFAGRERAAILDGMSEAVLALDELLKLRTANRAARELFGLSEEGGNRGLPVVEATRSAELAELAAECRYMGGPIEREIALYGKGGERWFRVLAAPFGAPRGEAFRGASPLPLPGEGLVLVFDDITKLRHLERVRTDFVANVSHELRTPIQVIKGFAETLREGALADPEKGPRYVDIIGRNATRMENLIGDLLSLARLEQEGGAALERTDEAVAALVEEAVAAVTPRAESKSMPIVAEIEPGLRARVHGGLIVQALVNLLDNAAKYAPAGSPITVAARRTVQAGGGDALILEVRDRGPGIPARDLPRLFERFYTVDKARSKELGGTGLGLAIVRHVALAHGGETGAESWEGEGSRFWLSIPV